LRLLQSANPPRRSGREIDGVDRSVSKLGHEEALMRNVNRKMINAPGDPRQRDRPLKLQLNRRLTLRCVAESSSRQRE
jgi:hypothetical protein